MYYNTGSTTVNGVDYIPIDVEVTINNGIPNMRIVGLSDKSIQESKERIVCAFRNSGLTLPAKKIRVNLAPSEIHKSGTGTDLAIACSILGCQNRFGNIKVYAFGELNMNGDINLAKGAFQFLQYIKSIHLSNKEKPTVFFPFTGLFMLKLFPELNIQLCKSLADINKNTYLQSGQLICKDDRENIHEESINNGSSFLSNICGNEKTKKALQISATGHHHILLSGPVGTGKSLLARSLIHLLPNISAEEKLEIIKVQNLIPTNIKNLHIEEAHRPFREISRNTTITALTGNDYIPGEFSLANKGVLLFDELAEASPKIINQLREPIEQRYIVINRARSKVIYPTDFIFVGATNLCPCGKYGSKYNQCTCSINERRRYIQKISHAILNRIDLFCTLNEVNLNNSLSGLTFDYKAENMRVIKQIAAATAIQKNRYEAEIFKNNGQVPYEQFDKYCRLSVTAYKTINKAVEKLHLNGRDYVKTIRVARTIADLENTDTISEDQICEALSYRNYLFEN